MTYTMHLPDGASFSFDNFYLAPATYHEAFSATGFSSVRWHRPAISEAGVALLGEDYWREFRADPPVIGIEAQGQIH